MGIQKQITIVISTKGQVMLPRNICDGRHWSPGTRLSVEETPDGVLLKAVPVFPATSVEAVFASLRHTGPALSIEDMDLVVTREAERRARD